MNKTDFIAHYAEAYELTKVAARENVESVMDIIISNLTAGEEFAYPGFGTIALVKRNPRTARNPMTGEPVEVPAHYVLKFKPASALKAAVKEL